MNSVDVHTSEIIFPVKTVRLGYCANRFGDHFTDVLSTDHLLGCVKSFIIV